MFSASALNLQLHKSQPRAHSSLLEERRRANEILGILEEPIKQPQAKRYKSAIVAKEEKDNEKAKEEKDDEEAKGVAKVDTNLTLKYDIHISDDDKSTNDPAPAPVWICGIDWGNQWCVRVSPNHPGHPNNVNQTARKNYSVTQHPLVGYIRGTLFVIEGPAPPDVTVKTWQRAQQEFKHARFPPKRKGQRIICT